VSPGSIYLLTFALIAIPLLPFSRSAVLVACAWLPGQFVYLAGADTTLVDAAIAAVACGAGMAFARCWTERGVALLFGISALVLSAQALGEVAPYSGWWTDWCVAMGRVLLLPATLNWSALGEVLHAFRRRREIERDVWRRVLCWRSI
jgi:hypothetical protein